MIVRQDDKFKFQDLEISKITSKDYLNAIRKDLVLYTNDTNILYRMPNISNGKFGVTICFKSEHIAYFSISLGEKYGFPPFVITDEERRVIKKVINEIGGEKKYEWGEVSLFEDLKSSSISIIVSYFW